LFFCRSRNIGFVFGNFEVRKSLRKKSRREKNEKVKKKRCLDFNSGGAAVNDG